MTITAPVTPRFALPTLPEPVWYAAFAALAYAVLAVAAWLAGPRHIRALRLAAIAGAALLPLLVLVGLGQRQEEVEVVRRSAQHLLAHGTPYPGGMGTESTAYNPYLPGMSLFGLPGLDPGVLFAAACLGTVAMSVWLRRADPGPLTLVLASPLVALTVATGGDDLPVLGLSCLGLALAGRRPELAGLVLGFAATLKATAWPALFIGLVLVMATSGGGRRFTGAAGAVMAVGLGLPVLADPHGFTANAVLFPLGLTPAASPADSPLPGHLLAELGSMGHATALILLVVSAVGMAVSLLVSSPSDARAAARRLALGLALAACLMPATRWGYFVYPLVLAVWSLAPESAGEPAEAVRAEDAVRADDTEEPWLAA